MATNFFFSQWRKIVFNSSDSNYTSVQVFNVALGIDQFLWDQWENDYTRGCNVKSGCMSTFGAIILEIFMDCVCSFILSSVRSDNLNTTLKFVFFFLRRLEGTYFYFLRGYIC